MGQYSWLLCYIGCLNLNRRQKKIVSKELRHVFQYRCSSHVTSAKLATHAIYLYKVSCFVRKRFEQLNVMLLNCWSCQQMILMTRYQKPLNFHIDVIPHQHFQNDIKFSLKCAFARPVFWKPNSRKWVHIFQEYGILKNRTKKQFSY